MRHGKKINHLSRTSSHRKAMLSNMATSLIRHKRIKTTLAKAKALKLYVEPLLTKAKKDTVHSRRIVFSYLQDKAIINEVFGEVAEKIANRPGGYTRILKTGFRPGDNAEMCMMELVDYNENMFGGTTAAKAAEGKKRTRRGKKPSEETENIKGKAKADQAGMTNEPKGDKEVDNQLLDTKNEAARHDINESMKAEEEKRAAQAEHLPKQVDSHTHKSTIERKDNNDNN